MDSLPLFDELSQTWSLENSRSYRALDPCLSRNLDERRTHSRPDRWHRRHFGLIPSPACTPLIMTRLAEGNANRVIERHLVRLRKPRQGIWGRIGELDKGVSDKQGSHIVNDDLRTRMCEPMCSQWWRDHLLRQFWLRLRNKWVRINLCEGILPAARRRLANKPSPHTHQGSGLDRIIGMDTEKHLSWSPILANGLELSECRMEKANY